MMINNKNLLDHHYDDIVRAQDANGSFQRKGNN